jgi:acyl-CoA thioesterase-2
MPAHEHPGEDAPANVGELVALLELEPLDRDLFRAHNAPHGGSKYHLFGGQVAAQALRAASLTVDADRAPHSIHGYFLRPGRSDIPAVHSVDRDRDGRSISARRVTVVQDGQVIFTMSASFGVEGDGPRLNPGLEADTPLPDDLEPSTVSPAHPAFEIRNLTSPTHNHGMTDAYWSRPHEPLPDDPSIHACVLAYLSDMGVGEGELTPHLKNRSAPSVDHAVWFHQPARLDEWNLLSMRPIAAQAGRLLYTGSIHSIDGALVATMIQECLLRPHRQTR